MLLRVYTQNIDGLEERAGVSPRKVGKVFLLFVVLYVGVETS